jgi:hypothetical protein
MMMMIIVIIILIIIIIIIIIIIRLRSVGFEVPTALFMKIYVFWDITDVSEKNIASIYKVKK